MRVLHALDARHLRTTLAVNAAIPSDIVQRRDDLAGTLWSGALPDDETPLHAWRDHQLRDAAARPNPEQLLVTTPHLAVLQASLGPATLVAWHIVGDDLLIERMRAPARGDRGYQLTRVPGIVPDLANRVARVCDAMQLAASAPSAVRAPVDVNAELRAIYEHLLCAVGDLPRDAPLLLAPDGFLFGVPFAALRADGACPSGGTWFGDDHPLSVLPTALWPALVALDLTPGSGQAVVFGAVGGASPLPGGAAELAQVSRTLADTRLRLQVFCDDPALCAAPPDLASYAEAAPTAEVLHIVAHGTSASHPWLAERGAGTLSHVELVGPDGPERLWEHRVLATPLQAQLVVLSACDRAALDDLGDADLLAQEHALGLARAFLGAGARTVLATQWPVDDEATFRIMERVYEQYIHELEVPPEGRDPWSRALVLREAQHQMRQFRAADGSTPYAHPFYWAGVTLVGMPGW